MAGHRMGLEDAMEHRIAGLAGLGEGERRCVKAGEEEVLVLRHEGRLVGMQAKCPHAKGPLEKGAICNGRLVCPWHMATFALPTGELVEPPATHGLRMFAVREDGADAVVTEEAAEEKKEFAVGGEKTVVLVGCGAAGTMAAVTLRKEGFDGRIVAVDAVADEPVDRTQLTKNALIGSMPLEKTKMGDALEGLAVERRTARVERLSAAEKTVTLMGGEQIGFDAALVATGGEPQRLEMEGAALCTVIRHTKDVEAIAEKATDGGRAVVIGTSFIGLEAASALTQRGMKVLVVGERGTPFAKKFGEEVGQAVMALHMAKGVEFHLGAKVTSVDAKGVMVEMEQGPVRLDAEVVVMGMGVKPALGFEHDLKVTEKGGVAVDASLLAAEGVWVAGDIAEVDGTRIEHWRLAMQHGMVAGLGMAKGGAQYEGVPFFWTTHFGKRMGYLGHADAWDEIATDGDVKGMEFLAYYMKDGAVKAVLGCGRDHAMATLAEPMRERMTLDEAKGVVAKSLQ